MQSRKEMCKCSSIMIGHFEWFSFFLFCVQIKHEINVSFFLSEHSNEMHCIRRQCCRFLFSIRIGQVSMREKEIKDNGLKSHLNGLNRHMIEVFQASFVCQFDRYDVHACDHNVSAVCACAHSTQLIAEYDNDLFQMYARVICM